MFTTWRFFLALLISSDIYYPLVYSRSGLLAHSLTRPPTPPYVPTSGTHAHTQMCLLVTHTLNHKQTHSQVWPITWSLSHSINKLSHLQYVNSHTDTYKQWVNDWLFVDWVTQVTNFAFARDSFYAIFSINIQSSFTVQNPRAKLVKIDHVILLYLSFANSDSAILTIMHRNRALLKMSSASRFAEVEKNIFLKLSTIQYQTKLKRITFWSAFMFKGILQLNKYIFACDWLAYCSIVKAIDLLWRSFSLTVFMNDNNWWSMNHFKLYFCTFYLGFYIIILIPCNYVLLHFLFFNIIVWSSLSRWSLAVYSDCIWKGLESVRSCFVYKYTHLLALQWTRNFQYCTRLRLVQYLKLLVHCAASACVTKHSQQSLTHN